HVAGSVLVVVAGSSVGRGDLGSADRMHHGVDPDSSGGRVATRGRELALCRSRVGAWHGHPRPRPSLFLDRHAALLVRDRWILFGVGTVTTARDGRACGV